MDATHGAWSLGSIGTAPTEKINFFLGYKVTGITITYILQIPLQKTPQIEIMKERESHTGALWPIRQVADGIIFPLYIYIASDGNLCS